MKRIVVVIAGILVIGAGAWLVFSGSESSEQDDQNQQVTGDEQQSESQEVTYLQLNGNEYKTLFLDSSHPNTKVIVEPPAMTGSDQADAVIVELAEARGYVLQEVPQQDLNSYDGLLVQDRLENAWSGLAQEAAEQGHTLNIESAFRSIDEQRVLFMGAINARGISNDQIISRQVDAALDEIMQMVAPPGYSRHHSGYVIDVSDASATVFEYSDGYTWISENNYQKAKEHGFIPSYPEGATNQGPDPEAWEYVWVGQPLLIE